MTGKPRITVAAVAAAYEILDRYEIPDDYHARSKAEQRTIKMDVVRLALAAAWAATPSPTQGADNE